MNTDISTIIQAAENGGKIIAHYFGKALDIEEKSTASDFRTHADIETEQTILKELQSTFSSYNFFSEEVGRIDNGSEYTFVIDPLDGSNNFVLGLPVFSVSIALLKGKTIIAGVVHHPILKKTYYALKGKGSFLDKNRLKVNKESNIKHATVSYTCSYLTSSKRDNAITSNITTLGVKRILKSWSPAFEFCLLADGKLEAIINDKNDLYDFAAGKLIAQEAGAMITDFTGQKEKNDLEDTFLATNGTLLHQSLLKIVKYYTSLQVPTLRKN